MKTVKSALAATALSLAIAAGITAGETLVRPDAAQAGIIGSVKGAAKKVGGAVKSTAKGIGAAAKAGAAAGRQVGAGVGGTIKRAAVRVGREARKFPLVKEVKSIAGKPRNAGNQ